MLRALAEHMPALARATDSGLPADAAIAVESTAGGAVAAAVQLHLALDLSDSIGAREHLESLRGQLEFLEKFVPAAYVCPMGHEGGKSYPAPGTCPVCGMTLVDARAHQDHTPKHGGVFMMAPDFLHHLEAVFGEDRTLRVYFYDEFTRPMPAAGFTARVSLVGGRRKPDLTLTPVGPSAPECLEVRLPPETHRRPHVVLRIDFHGGRGEHLFDVDFARNAGRP
jgi:hypothetical protein